MLKYITLFHLTLLLCSCEIFGWDSSGGNNAGIIETIQEGDPETSTGDLFYINVPMAYPKIGSEIPTETASGSQISIIGLDELPRTNVLSAMNALILTQAACDQTADSITDIAFSPTETSVEWLNTSAEAGSLTISNDTIGTPALQVISCIE